MAVITYNSLSQYFGTISPGGLQLAMPVVSSVQFFVNTATSQSYTLGFGN